MRDTQKSKVYKWENKVIKPLDDTTKLSINEAQRFVNKVWLFFQLKKPPMVTLLPKNNKHTVADATRDFIRIRPRGINTWILIHELAHCLATIHTRKPCSHNHHFLGIYVYLLSKYLKLDRTFIEQSIEDNALKYKKYIDRNVGYV